MISREVPDPLQAAHERVLDVARAVNARGLSPVGQRVVHELVGEFGWRPQVQRLAQQAARFLELAEQVRAIVEAEGVVLQLATGPVPHPACEAEREMRLAYLAALHRLESPRRASLDPPVMAEALTPRRGGPRDPAARFFPLTRKSRADDSRYREMTA